MIPQPQGVQETRLGDVGEVEDVGDAEVVFRGGERGELSPIADFVELSVGGFDQGGDGVVGGGFVVLFGGAVAGCRGRRGRGGCGSSGVDVLDDGARHEQMLGGEQHAIVGGGVLGAQLGGLALDGGSAGQRAAGFGGRVEGVVVGREDEAGVEEVFDFGFAGHQVDGPRLGSLGARSHHLGTRIGVYWRRCSLKRKSSS